MNNNNPICSYCGQDYHGDTRIFCEVCQMQVCIMALNGGLRNEKCIIRYALRQIIR